MALVAASDWATAEEVHFSRSSASVSIFTFLRVQLLRPQRVRTISAANGLNFQQLGAALFHIDAADCCGITVNESCVGRTGKQKRCYGVGGDLKVYFVLRDGRLAWAKLARFVMRSTPLAGVTLLTAPLDLK